MGNPGSLQPLDGPSPADHDASQEAESARHARLLGELRQELDDTNRGLIALHTELETTRLAEARLAAMVASSDDAMFSLDLDCRVQTWNPGARRLLAHTEQHITGQPADTLMSDAARAALRTALEQIRSDRRAESYACRWLRADGTEVDVAVTVSAMRDAGGGLIGYCATARDITHQLAAQAELAAARADREVMAERDRIARDLHDMVIQRVFGAGLALQSTAARLPHSEADRIHTAIGELDATIRELRTTIFDLHQPAQKAASLRAQVLDETSAAHDRLGFAPSVEFDGPVDAALPDATAAHLLAVLREALSNAARHAHASAVTVSIQAGGDLLLEVTDNGRGLDPAVTRSSGLTNLRRRAERLGGSFDIVSPAGSGTHVRWRIPLIATDPALTS
ncbi:PAS domain-containing sensor histidine kinase [Streptomyces sp. ADMS]|uniref:PAS domain-containing sensor histidine kinase n=1 Tax=Streptomyces sp. ADMS TaxID=3071415 RepID=UPI00296EC021|nr:PAS domain-containing sensor histidine kinase [Streptomyces sp. ADMS]MDW4904078.1 PAS domain-containing sensor histidine kinase [Streptomyces sp. ADMS]